MLGIPTCAAGAFANMAKASRATLEAELREMTATIRWHRQRQVQSAKRDRKRSRQRPFGLSPNGGQLVAAIYVLSEFDASNWLLKSWFLCTAPWTHLPTSARLDD